MSVPYAPPGYVDILTRAREARDQRLLPAVLPEARRARGRAAAGHPRRAAPPLLHGRRRARGEGQGLRPADRPARLLGNTVDPPTLPAWLSEADLDYYTQRIRAHRLPRRAELVSQPPAQLGAGRAVARPADPPALAVHRRQPDGVLRFPGGPVAARCLPEDLARPARQPHHRRRRPLGAAGAAGRGQQTADRLPEGPVMTSSALEAPMIRLLVAMLLLAGLGAVRPAAELYVDGSRACDRRTGPRPRAVLSRRDHRRTRQRRHRHEPALDVADRRRRIPGSAAAHADARQPGGRAERPLSPRRRLAETGAALRRLRHDRHRLDRLSADRDRDRRRRLPGDAQRRSAPPA